MEVRLFDIAPEMPPKKNKSNVTCFTCVHRQRWEFGSKIFQYCGKLKSKRTQNGLLKIRAKDPACDLYEKE